MSILINNQLIWVSIPRCASVSIEDSLKNNNQLQINLTSKEPYPNINTNHHFHFRKNFLLEEFGFQKTCCITRNWFDRWYSALEYFFEISYHLHRNELKYNWSDIDNNFIYEYFNKNLADAIYCDNEYKIQKEYSKFFNVINKNLPDTLSIFACKNYWTDNTKCDYEFDISEIDKFKNLIYEKFGVVLKIKKMNGTSKIKNKIEVNDELKKWVWDVFEKPFTKNMRLV